MTASLKRYLLLLCGSISLALGIIGIFVPVLPTTPFLLLSAFCYLHSSEKLYNWLINHRVFGSYIQNYLKHRAVTLKTKKIAVASVLLSISLSVYLVSNVYVGGVVLTLIGIAVIWYLLSLNTISEASPD